MPAIGLPPFHSARARAVLAVFWSSNGVDPAVAVPFQDQLGGLALVIPFDFGEPVDSGAPGATAETMEVVGIQQARGGCCRSWNGEFRPWPSRS